VAEVERWHQRWRSGLARLAGVDETWLPLAAARVQAALAAYRAGSGALNAVLEARQAELALRLERVQIEFETASDWARLNTLIPQSETAP
jgi:outer membrane protein TolC